MLGSHNSLTYLPCRKWWMYLINWAAKCQSKTLSEQFHDDVKYFDIRVRFNKDKKPVIAHGLVEYKGELSQYINLLNNLAKHFDEKIYVRFVLEFNKEPKDWFEQSVMLNTLICEFRTKFPYLIYDYSMRKWDERDIRRYNTDTIYLTHKYSSCIGWKRFLWIPWVYAKLYNKKNMKENEILINSENAALMLDFI